MQILPTLVSKALIDSGYDLLHPAANGWYMAAISGFSAIVAVHVQETDTLLAVPEAGVMERIGLPASTHPLPPGMVSAGLAGNPAQLYEALRLLHALQTRPASTLSAEVETRLAAIPVTERTREVHQRIGQDVFRGALMDLWQGRCALSGVELPTSLLRASHAKPWANANDEERLDPFNGLLLAVHYDALFDQGLIAFGDDGQVIVSASITEEVRRLLCLSTSSRLRFVLPGHKKYLSFHRRNIAEL